MSGATSLLESQAKNLHRTLRHRIQLANFESACRFVENGVGIAVMPESSARRYRRTMKIRLLRLTDDWAVRRIYICVREIELLPSLTQKLVAHLVKLGGATS